MSRWLKPSEIWEDLRLVCDILSIFATEMLRPKFRDTSAKGHLQSNTKQILTCFFQKVHLKFTFFERLYTYLCLQFWHNFPA